MTHELSHIRNFSIIAHIDHGKSTLSDRILELTGTVAKRDMQAQLLDSMDIERERGITIKSQAVRVSYTADDGETYQLNLIDTPGHVDFTYEVSRSLAACDGAVLVVDATQGVEAQTVANAMLAMNADLEIIPLINKIDLPAAEPERVKAEIEDGLAIPADDAVLASGKTGEGVHDLLEAVVYNIPAPEGDGARPLARAHLRQLLRRLPRRGGPHPRGRRSHQEGRQGPHDGHGHGDARRRGGRAARPRRCPTEALCVGEVGYLVTGLKDVSQVKVGDTITVADGGVNEPLPGYREAKPMVFTGLFPIDGDRVRALEGGAGEAVAQRPGARVGARDLSCRSASASAWAFWACCTWRSSRSGLEREFGLDLLATAPSVEYHVYLKGGEMVSLHSPQEMPDPGSIDHVEEPYLKAKILIPPDYVGAVMDLAVGRRGNFVTMNYLSQTTVEMLWEIPLSELILDFFDKLKSEHEGLRVPRLRDGRLQALAAREAGHPAFGQAHRRAVVHRAQGQGLRPRRACSATS